MQWRKLISIAVLLIALLGGCGGSGSSGFDLAPQAEDANIDRALQEKRCIAEGELAICPADQTLVVPNPPGSHPLGDPVQLDVASAPIDIRGCSSATVCTLEIRFSASGIPAGATYQPAARRSDDRGWTLGAAIQPQSPSEDEVRTSIDVAPQDIEQQLAVLIYLDGEAAAAGEIATLYQSGADLAFITSAD